MLCPRGWILQNTVTYPREWESGLGALDPVARRIDLSRFEAQDRRIPGHRGRPCGFIVGTCFSNMRQVMEGVANTRTGGRRARRWRAHGVAAAAVLRACSSRVRTAAQVTATLAVSPGWIPSGTASWYFSWLSSQRACQAR